MTRKNGRIRRRTNRPDILSTTNPIRIGPESEPELRGDRQIG